ncbi:MAG: hypothetical protein M5U28_04095, partial [Sandaracinaceae bacterium]|nr:hypothetical protein [Sandaracinaceae bacterium]
MVRPDLKPENVFLYGSSGAAAEQVDSLRPGQALDGSMDVTVGGTRSSGLRVLVVLFQLQVALAIHA